MSAQLRLLALVSLLVLIRAHPSYWVTRFSLTQCSSHPTTGIAVHGAPSADSGIGISVLDTSGAPIQALCPGASYSIQVSLPQAREALLTSSKGSLARANAASCPGRLYADRTTTSISTTLTLPCGTAAGPVQLSVTSAASAFSEFATATATLTVDSTCAAPSCTTSPTAGGGTPPPAAAPPPTTGSPPPPQGAPPPTTGSTATQQQGASNPCITANHNSSPSSHSSASGSGSTPSPSPPSSTAPSPSNSTSPTMAGDDTRGEHEEQEQEERDRRLQDCVVLTTPSGSTGSPAGSTSGSQSSKQGSGCGISTLGYACAKPVGAATLHWTYSSSSTAPNNTCTREAADAAGPVQTSSTAGGSYIHFAIENTAYGGYVGLGFTESPGRMTPSYVVQGALAADGGGYASAYRVTDYELPAPLDPADTTGWLMNLGASRSPSGRAVICFTRPTATPAASSASATAPGGRRRLGQSAPSTDAAGPGALDASASMSLIWAAHTGTTGTHEAQGGVSLNVVTGEVVVVGSNLNNLIIAHGVLMVLGFVLLMPTGLLLARHKQLVPAVKLGGKDVWYWTHMGCQLTGTACFIAGVAIALSKFPRNNVPAPDRPLLTAHYALGIVLVALVGLQVLAALLLRPAPGAPRRAAWNAQHHWTGRVTVLSGLVNCGLGIALLPVGGWGLTDERTELGGVAAWVVWTVPVAVVSGLLVVADLVLRLYTRWASPASSNAVTPASVSSLPDAAADLKLGGAGGKGFSQSPHEGGTGSGSVTTGTSRSSSYPDAHGHVQLPAL